MAELIIVFREVFEASLIIGILYTYLNKSGNNSSLKMLWMGVSAALIASIIGSFLFQMIAGGFEGQSEKLFEGIVMIVAAFVLSSMIIWMARNQNISEDLKSKAAESLSGFGYGIFSLAFISVFREGIETILFLYGVMINKGGISIFSSLVGACLALMAGYAIFIQGRKLLIKKFFNITSVLLIFVASGMLAYGVHELESADVIPYLSGEVDISENSMLATRLNGNSKTFDFNLDTKDSTIKKSEKWASRLWDINPPKNLNGTYPVFHDKGSVGGLIKGLFGYNGDPSLVEFLSWLGSLIILFYLWRNSKREN